jgi:hypothetical protein
MTLCCSSSQVMPGSIPLAPIGDPPPYPPPRLTQAERSSSPRPPQPQQPQVLSAEDALKALGYKLIGPPKRPCSRTILPTVQEGQNEAWPILELCEDIKLGNCLRYRNPRTRKWHWKHFWRQEGPSFRWARMRVWKPKHAPTLMMASRAEGVSDGDPEWLLHELSNATWAFVANKINVGDETRRKMSG